MTDLSQETLNQLAQYDTPTVCNVIELFDVRPRNQGYMNDSIKACFPKLPPMVGFALTSTFRSMAPPKAGDAYGSLTDQVDIFASLPGPPVMVFQDLDEPTVSATFGEVMCTMYKSFGSAGLITSGAGRDLDQVEVLDYPVFTNGTICSHGYCHIPQINVPVTVGGIAINPVDLLHGDVNGVTTVPPEIASEIPDACKELMAAEQVILDYCKSGSINPKGLAEARAASQELIGKLAQRLKR
ncbi:RraA family protein [Thalassoglobus polymorphus]|uniref:Putative 4-hydroxy-4-methyl-2-oxoglutarate aldolase n=1 Tax=Thalassoglobus polymorphus TaxID=2527994 RepID=A0A517QLN0_9PLAN|nr:RraA family protein [Thalassoglobus polymorphus]QDT32544.1 4-hydroxy-4-methyl-2-oxoglutarate aldolase [Thalassoglobus polymorphus]